MTIAEHESALKAAWKSPDGKAWLGGLILTAAQIQDRLGWLRQDAKALRREQEADVKWQRRRKIQRAVLAHPSRCCAKPQGHLRERLEEFKSERRRKEQRMRRSVSAKAAWARRRGDAEIRRLAPMALAPWLSDLVAAVN